MNCPSCEVEMVDLNSDDQTLRKCSECGTLWIDVSDLNRMLLHEGLPGLETLGGKVNADEMAGQCSQCLVDLVCVEGGSKQHPLRYDTCESCGGVFLEGEFHDAPDAAAAKREIVNFFSQFSERAGKRKAAHG